MHFTTKDVLLHIDLHSEINRLFYFLFIRSFALGMISLFIPMFLYKQGFSINQILLFYLFNSLFSLIFIIPSVFIISKLGYRYGLMFSIPFNILFYLFFRFINNFTQLLLNSMIGGFALMLFWISFHSDFSASIRNKNAGEETSFMKVLTIIAGMLAPVLGGFIYHFFGFNYVIAIVSILFLSVIPFLRGKKHKINFNTKQILKFRKTDLAFIGEALNLNRNNLLWPLLVFLVLKSPLKLGISSSLTKIGVILFSLYVGKLLDNKKTLLKITSIANFIISFLKSFVNSFLSIASLNIISGFTESSSDISYKKELYTFYHSNNQIFEMFIRREIVLRSSVVLFILLQIFILKDIRISIMFSSLGSLLLLTILKKE